MWTHLGLVINLAGLAVSVETVSCMLRVQLFSVEKSPWFWILTIPGSHWAHIHFFELLLVITWPRLLSGSMAQGRLHEPSIFHHLCLKNSTTPFCSQLKMCTTISFCALALPKHCNSQLLLRRGNPFSLGLRPSNESKYKPDGTQDSSLSHEQQKCFSSNDTTSLNITAAFSELHGVIPTWMLTCPDIPIKFNSLSVHSVLLTVSGHGQNETNFLAKLSYKWP